MSAFSKFTTLSAILLILTGGLFSCEEKKEYPKEIPFVEYSLIETSCEWTVDYWHSSGGYSGNIIVINSSEDLKNHINCNDYPSVDFSKQTLLLVYGLSPSQPQISLSKQFWQISTNNYSLNIEILLGVSRVIGVWDVALLVPKIANGTTITLDVLQSQ